MLTEEFKRRAIEKLKNTPPDMLVQILKSIGSVPVNSTVNPTPLPTVDINPTTVALDTLPSKIQIPKKWPFYSSFEITTKENISITFTKDEISLLSFTYCKKGYDAA